MKFQALGARKLIKLINVIKFQAWEAIPRPGSSASPSPRALQAQNLINLIKLFNLIRFQALGARKLIKCIKLINLIALIKFQAWEAVPRPCPSTHKMNTIRC